MNRVGRLAAAIAAAVGAAAAAVAIHPRTRQAAGSTAKRQSANVAALVGTSVGRAVRRRPDDVGLTEAVRGAIAVHGAQGVTVTAHRGTVTLRGEVPALDDIDALEDAARAAGARDVNNLLRLPANAVARPGATQPS